MFMSVFKTAPRGGDAVAVWRDTGSASADVAGGTHAGSGWRHLVSGRLRIETDHGAQIIETGMSWFEPANSPVRAVALQTSGVTRFVRCMVIPQSFVGLSTFQLCNPKDAELERLQLTHRHFDHIL